MTRMSDEAERSLNRGLDWLMAQQGADGGWHSKTYGQLKDGASVTALALYAASLFPEWIRKKHSGVIDRGFAFLEGGIVKRGAVASPDGSLDFPTYASALWLTVCARLHRHTVGMSRMKVADYLLTAQVAEPRGFEQDSISFGGWDLLGCDDAEGITTGTNISVTQYVLQALSDDFEWHRKSNGSSPPGSFVRSVQSAIIFGKSYVLRCQQADGGFAFTCERASLNNKAAYSDSELTKPRSYGTATCDGVLALIACGLKTSDESVAKAIAWLAKRPGLEVVPGFEGLPAEDGWDRGLRFYYYSALSRVLPYFPLSEREARQQALVKHVVSLQKDDGSWVNESDRMRENDPLIATGLAVSALANGIAGD